MLAGVLSVMSAALWKSRPFWAFAGVTSAFGAGVAYDRFKAAEIRKAFMAEAMNFGAQPLLEHESPQLIALYCMSPTTDVNDAIKSNFRRYSVELLTAAGIDYVWGTDLNCEQVTKEWNRQAQEANQPELMLEGEKHFSVAELQEHLLKPNLREYFGRVNIDSSLWNKLREQMNEKRGWQTPYFVALNESSLTSIQSLTETILLEPLPVIPTPKPTWWQRLTLQKPLLKTQSLPPQPEFFLFPCELPNSLVARFTRYFFGQRQVVSSIGASTLQLIRHVNKVPNA